ncbi:MAG: M42 family metallopeptidase [Planctomycetota bacterium]|nr:M42 family metallopeptidase [Planctomycetota bacterium]
MAERELLERLTLAAGAPGAEDEVRAIVRDTLAEIGTISYDKLGSILCEKKGLSDAPRVVLDAHMDEVAFLVQSVLTDGFLRFVTLGGWWPHVLLGHRVDVVTANGKIPGVIGSKPPHFLTAEERKKVLKIEDMYIDVGARSVKDAERLGIALGDPIVPRGVFEEMADADLLTSKAFDDRAGIGVMCEVLRGLTGDHPSTVIGVGTVQEEVGIRGAGTAAELARPDVAIALECTGADDIPGFDVRQAVLGDGPQIRVFDPTALFNRKLVRLATDVARENGITHQMAVRRTGGTDAARIERHATGVPTVVISVPARYIHSHTSVISWKDYVGTVDLVKALVGRLDAETVAGLTDFS